MVDFPEVELQAALMAALGADAGVTEHCPGGVWDGAPEGEIYPFAVLASMNAQPDNKGSSRGSRVAVSFEVSDRPGDPAAGAATSGAVRARNAAAAIRAALEDRPELLTVEGAHVWNCEFAGSTVTRPDLKGVAGKVAFLIYFNDLS